MRYFRQGGCRTIGIFILFNGAIVDDPGPDSDPWVGAPGQACLQTERPGMQLSHPASQWPRHLRALQTVEMAFLRCVFNAKGKSVKRNSCMQRHYYICKTRKIVWPNEAMDARLSTVLAEI